MLRFILWKKPTRSGAKKSCPTSCPFGEADAPPERDLRAQRLDAGLHPVGCPDQEGYGNCRSCGSRTIHNHLENPAGLRTVPTASTTNQLKKIRENEKTGTHRLRHTNTKDTKLNIRENLTNTARSKPVGPGRLSLRQRTGSDGHPDLIM